MSGLTLFERFSTKGRGYNPRRLKFRTPQARNQEASVT